MRVILSETGKIITGNTPKTSDQNNYASNDIPFVKPSDISERDISLIDSTGFWISEYAREKARILPVESVLVTCIGIIGKVAITERECAFNQQINAIIPNDNYLPEYLAYAILAKQSYLQEIANAPVVPIINKSQFGDIEIQDADLRNQRIVVDKLNAISHIISLSNAQLKKLDELIKSRFVEMFGDPVKNTNSFKLLSLQEMINKHIITYHLDGNHGGDYPRNEEFVSKGIPYISANCIENGIVSFSNAKYLSEERANRLRKGIAQNNDVLFAHNATVGPVAILKTTENKVILSTSLTAFRCNSDYLLPLYLKYFLLSEGFVRQYSSDMKQTTRNQVPITTQRKYFLLLPPFDLQKQFVDFATIVEKQKATVQQSIDKLETLKKSLMQDYFG